MLLTVVFLFLLVPCAAQADIAPATAQKLLAEDGAAFNEFGLSVSLSGDTASIGAFGNDSYKGAAYIFTRTDGIWSQQQKLTVKDGAALDALGIAVSVSGDTAVIGAHGDDNHTGSAYVFTRKNGIWTQQAKLTAVDRATDDWFGWAVSVSGDTKRLSDRSAMMTRGTSMETTEKADRQRWGRW